MITDTSDALFFQRAASYHKNIGIPVNVCSVFNAPWQKHINSLAFNLDLANSRFPAQLPCSSERFTHV